MKPTYDIAKEKGGRWYVCISDNPSVAIAGTYFRDKKDALHLAADRNGMSYKEFLKQRKSG